MHYQRRINPVQRSLSRPLTILGAERKLFFFYFAARWATATDPQILRLLLRAAKLRSQYDPAKLSPVVITRAT